MIALYDLDGEFLAAYPSLGAAAPFAYEQAETVGSAISGAADVSAILGAEIAERAADDGRDAWDIGSWPMVRAAVAAGLANPDDLVLNHEMVSWEAVRDLRAESVRVRRAWL